MRLIAPLCATFLLAACVSTPQTSAPPPPPQRPSGETQNVPPSAPPPPPVEGFRSPEILEGPGLAGVIRENAQGLIGQFGNPRLDMAEGDMRKLQFGAEACVMDVFLYPLRPGAEPVATWIETRRASDGAAVDRLACIQALRASG